VTALLDNAHESEFAANGDANSKGNENKNKEKIK